MIDCQGEGVFVLIAPMFEPRSCRREDYVDRNISTDYVTVVYLHVNVSFLSLKV
jgi:hypothetical protein